MRNIVKTVLILALAMGLFITGCNLTPRIKPLPSADATVAPTLEGDATSDPLDTTSPADTTSPDDTETPVDTESPIDTNQPVDTQTPEPTTITTGTPAPTPTSAATTTQTPAPTLMATPTPTPEPTPTPAPQSDFAAFTTQDILTGNSYSNSMFSRSGLTMINVWATWCGPCIAELPDIQRLQGTYGSRIQIVTILQDSPGEIEGGRAIANNIGLTLPILVNTPSVRAAIMDAYSVNALPFTFFVDSNGRILRTVQGSNNYDSWCSIINSLLG